MHVKCKMIFIDESGAGTNNPDKNSLWISAGICSSLDAHNAITADLGNAKQKFLRNPNEEFKGNLIPKHLKPGITADDVAKEIAAIMSRHNLVAWITGTRKQDFERFNKTFVPSNPKKGLQAKDIAREMLLERISGYTNPNDEDVYQLIWDLSDTNELSDFSAVTSSYVNPHNGKKIEQCIIPKILGGLSHDWAEIQIADLIANYALNYVAHKICNLPDADIEKSNAFKKHIYNTLAFSPAKGTINGIGWKLLGV